MKLFLLLGQRRYGNDAEALLWHICRSYSLARDNFVLNQISPFHYCYMSNPPTKKAVRDVLRRNRMDQIVELHKNIGPFKIVGFGWMACDMLFRVGKTKMKDRVGADWGLEQKGMNGKSAWLTYDPTAALFDPNMVVPISWVINHAAESADIKTSVNPDLEPYDWSKYL